MVENNDLHRIVQVAENYQELLRAHRKEVHVVLALAKVRFLNIKYLYVRCGADLLHCF